MNRITTNSTFNLSDVELPSESFCSIEGFYSISNLSSLRRQHALHSHSLTRSSFLDTFKFSDHKASFKKL